MEEKRVRAYPLRIPHDFKAWIVSRSEINRRSINTELNVMLEIAKEVIEARESENVEKPV